MTGKDKKLELQERELANVSGGEELETIPIEDISDQLNVKIGPMTAFSSGGKRSRALKRITSISEMNVTGINLQPRPIPTESP